MLDILDKKILKILIDNAKTPYAEIAKQLDVSNGTIHVRVKKMEKLGVLLGTSLILNYTKLGYGVFVFLNISLKDDLLCEEVSIELEKIPEICGIHFTTGNYSLLAELRCKDTEHLASLLKKKIQPIEGIQATNTVMSLERKISRPNLLPD